MKLQSRAVLRGFASNLIGPLLLLMLLAVACPQSAWAQLPRTRLYAIFPVGGKAGTDVELKIASGADMEGLNALQFSHPGITAKQKIQPPSSSWPFPKTLTKEYIVTIKADVPPGVYEVRSVGRNGVSNSRTFVVSDRQELTEKSGNDSIEKAQEAPIGAVINGTADGGSIDHYKFKAKKGQRFLIECLAERIDSRMDATLVLLDSAGRELKRNRDSIGRDPLIDFVAPADGEFIVRVYDLLYGGGSEYPYRLSIKTSPHIDFVMPPMGKPGTKFKATLYGRNLPGGQPAPEMKIDGQPLEKLTVEIDVPAQPQNVEPPINTLIRPAEAALDSFYYQLKTDKGASNPVRIGFASAPVVLEKEPNSTEDKPQKLNIPCEVAGQFYDRGDVDWYTFDAKKGQSLRIDVYSHRLGLTTDAYMLIQQVKKDAKGKITISDIKEVDDTVVTVGGTVLKASTDDPSYELKVPADGTYRILLRDLFSQSRGDPRLVYRLAIRPGEEDFRLVTLTYQGDKNSTNPWPVVLRQGASTSLNVYAFRRDGFKGPIDVTIENLPEGVTCNGATIGTGRTSASLILSAAEGAKAWVGPIKVVGKSKIGDKDVVRQARSMEIQWPGKKNSSMTTLRMAGAINLSVADGYRFPFSIQLADNKPLAMSRAGKLSVPIKVVRRDGFKGKLLLKLTGLPKEIKTKDINIDGAKNEGKFEITADTKAGISSYSLVITAATQIKYARDPQANAKAKEDQKKIVEILKKYTAELKAADTMRKKVKGDEKVKADKAYAEVQNKVKGINQAKKTVDALVKSTEKTSKPADVKLTVPVAQLSLKLTAAPIEFESGTAKVEMKQSGKAEVTVKLKRFYGYTDPITITLSLPKGIKGVTIEGGKAQIAKGQTEIKANITAAKTATAGDYTCQLRAQVKYNGQTLTISRPIQVKVDKVEAPKKPAKK